MDLTGQMESRDLLIYGQALEANGDEESRRYFAARAARPRERQGIRAARDAVGDSPTQSLFALHSLEQSF